MNKFRRRVLLLLAVTAFAFTGFLLADWLYPLPLPSAEKDFARVVVDENGRPLRAFADSQGVWRYQTSTQQVSEKYLEALLNYEDRWFYYHPGVNPLALLRATLQNLWAGRILSGGSTLTMQVARRFDPHRRSYLGKLRQAFRALQLEWHFSKLQILNFYLNYVPFGGPVEGVAAASYMYLDKSPDQLDYADAALLAVLPQRPSFYRPDRHPQRARQARDKVLDRLHNVWSEQIIREAKQQPVSTVFHSQPNTAALFARFARKQQADQTVIKTTLNSELQQQLEDYARQQAARLPRGTSIALLVVDHKTMQIKAYVGSADFRNAQRFGHVDMIQATRSPGSTLKPFLYGLAIDEGLIHSESLLTDAPQQFGDYHPQNFSGGFNGPVSVSEALQRSLNIPAVQVLQALGVNRFSNILGNAGIRLSTPDKANLSMILGGTGTTLWQLVKAYSALANRGQVQPLRWQPGASSPSRYLLSEGSSWIIRDILSRQKRRDRLNLNRSRNRTQDLAWKTGTSYGFRDAWAIGINAQYTIGVWVGRPDATPLPGFYGANSAAPMLIELHNFLTDEQYHSLGQKPDTVSQQEICWPLGTLKASQPDEFCHQTRSAWLLDDNAPPTLADNSLQQFDTNPLTLWVNNKGERVQPSCADSATSKKLVALWPLRVSPWVHKNLRRKQQIPDWSAACKQQHSLQDYRNLRILGSSRNMQLVKAGTQAADPSIDLKAIGGSGRYQWFINGQPYAENNPQQRSKYTFSRAGRYQITVKDEVGNVDRIDVEVVLH